MFESITLQKWDQSNMVAVFTINDETDERVVSVPLSLLDSDSVIKFLWETAQKIFDEESAQKAESKKNPDLSPFIGIIIKL